MLHASCLVTFCLIQQLRKRCDSCWLIDKDAGGEGQPRFCCSPKQGAPSSENHRDEVSARHIPLSSVNSLRSSSKLDSGLLRPSQFPGLARRVLQHMEALRNCSFRKYSPSKVTGVSFSGYTSKVRLTMRTAPCLGSFRDDLEFLSVH